MTVIINEAVTFQSLGVHSSYPLNTEVWLYVDYKTPLHSGLGCPWNSTFVASDLGLFQAELSA